MTETLDALAQRLTEALAERDEAVRQRDLAWQDNARKVEATNRLWRRVEQLSALLETAGVEVPAKWPSREPVAP